MKTQLEPGSQVTARSAFGNLLQKRVVRGPDTSGSFPVVWVCSLEEWEEARDKGRAPIGTPWPVEDVSEHETASA